MQQCQGCAIGGAALKEAGAVQPVQQATYLQPPHNPCHPPHAYGQGVNVRLRLRSCLADMAQPLCVLCRIGNQAGATAETSSLIACRFSWLVTLTWLCHRITNLSPCSLSSVSSQLPLVRQAKGSFSCLFSFFFFFCLSCNTLS